MSFSVQNKLNSTYSVTLTDPLFSDPAEGFSESRRTFTISLLQVFLHIFKELQYIKHMDCEALTSKAKKKKSGPPCMGHTHASTNSALQFLSVSNRAIRLSSTLCPRPGTLRKYWHHVCHLSISPPAQRWLEAGADKLQLATEPSQHFTELLGVQQ